MAFQWHHCFASLYHMHQQSIGESLLEATCSCVAFPGLASLGSSPTSAGTCRLPIACRLKLIMPSPCAIAAGNEPHEADSATVAAKAPAGLDEPVMTSTFTTPAAKHNTVRNAAQGELFDAKHTKPCQVHREQLCTVEQMSCSERGVGQSCKCNGVLSCCNIA